MPAFFSRGLARGKKKRAVFTRGRETRVKMWHDKNKGVLYPRERKGLFIMDA